MTVVLFSHSLPFGVRSLKSCVSDYNMTVVHEPCNFQTTTTIDFKFGVRDYGVISILHLEFYFNQVNRLGSSSAYIHTDIFPTPLGDLKDHGKNKI